MINIISAITMAFIVGLMYISVRFDDWERIMEDSEDEK